MLKSRNVNRNPHFWAIVTIIIAIVLIYYSKAFSGYRPEWLWRLNLFEFQNNFHGILFCIPIIYTAIIFWWRGVLTIWLITLVITLPMLVPYKPTALTVLTNIFFLFIPVLIVGYITLERNWRNKERKSMIEREKERQDYVTQILRAQEDERKRIAQELHDETIHSLLIIARKVTNLTSNGNNLSAGDLKSKTTTINDDIIHLSDELRRLCADLRPGMLDNLGFLPALRWLIVRLDDEYQITTKLIIEGEECKIPHNTEVLIFRIAQEALNNIRLHSGATEAMITMSYSPQKVKMTVQDNGKGFLLPRRLNDFSPKGKLGLIGIQERVRALNGTLDIHSRVHHGTSLSVEFNI